MSKQVKAIQELLSEMNSKGEALKDVFDLVEHDMGIPRRRVKIAKVQVDHAIAIVNGKPQLKNELSPADIKRIIQCVFDLCNGKRKFFMLMLNDNKSGVIDMNTEKQYFFRE